MRRLVDLSDLAPRQHEEVVALLNKSGVRFRETPANFMGFGAILVADEDFVRAREILRGEACAFAAGERAKWEREWDTQYKRSIGRWFVQRLRDDPMNTMARLILLIFMVGAFVVFPAWYVVRHY